jgi:hypothetical protein
VGVFTGAYLIPARLIRRKSRNSLVLCKLEFPGDSRVAGLLEEPRGMDRAIFLKIEIKPEDLNGFIAKSPFAATQLTSDSRSVMSNLTAVSWWTPDNAKTFQSGQVRLPEAKVLKILIDRDKKDKITIYLMWFST